MRLSDLLESKRLTNRLTQPVLLDADVAIRCARARKLVEEARVRLDNAERAEQGRLQQPRVQRAQAELDEAKAEQEAADQDAEAHLVDFVFESVGSTRWDQLVEEHPSPTEQKEQLGEGDPGYDLQRWPLAVVAECLKAPEVSGVDDVAALKDRVPDAVWQQILGAAVRVNRGANEVPKSRNGSQTTASSEPKSGPPSD